MSWFYFALLAPLLYAVVIIIDDNLVQFAFDSPTSGTALAGILGAIPVFGALFINISPISGKNIILSFLAGFFLTIFYYFYFESLKVSMPSVVNATLNLVPASLVLLAFFILNEKLNIDQLIGFFVVLVPSVMLALSVKELKKFKLNKGIAYTLLAVAALDVVSLLLKYTYIHSAFFPVFFYSAIGTGFGGLVFYLLNKFKKKKALIKTKLSLVTVMTFVLISGIINFGAELFINLAIDKGPVSLVRVIEGIQPIYVLLIALIFYPFAPKYFREAKGSNLIDKLVLITMTICGLVLIAKS